MDKEDDTVQRIKNRFLAVCRTIMLERLKSLLDRHPEVDPDLLMELVILTGIGYLNRMDRQEGLDHVSAFLDNLLQELTTVVCQRDEDLLEEAKAIIVARNKVQAEEAIDPDSSKVKVQVSGGLPLPGIGLFGFRSFGDGADKS